jgi:hypothetical protein
MSEKLNLLIHLNGYSDTNNSNEPTLNNFRWNREYLGLEITDPSSRLVNLDSGESLSLFSGSVSLSSDATTEYDIDLKSGSSSTYKIIHSFGTAPLFRTPRTSGADATTEVTVTKNAKVLKFESTGGTLFSLVVGGAVVGDKVRIGDVFNPSNRGEYKIIAITATSFSIENETGLAESNIVLGSGFASEVNIYSSAGVQVGDKIAINNGFSLVTLGTYEITDVSHNYIEFHSISTLPAEIGIGNDPEAFTIYRAAKQLVYIESEAKLNIKINGSTITNTIEPFQVNGTVKPGVFLSKSTLTSIEISNPTTNTCKVYYITAE